jgi:hypothetical protein
VSTTATPPPPLHPSTPDFNLEHIHRQIPYFWYHCNLAALAVFTLCSIFAFSVNIEYTAQAASTHNVAQFKADSLLIWCPCAAAPTYSPTWLGAAQQRGFNTRRPAPQLEVGHQPEPRAQSLQCSSACPHQPGAQSQLAISSLCRRQGSSGGCLNQGAHQTGHNDGSPGLIHRDICEESRTLTALPWTHGTGH